MDLTMAFAMVLGIGPALILMYLGVRSYTFPRVEQPFFSDPTFFMLFVAGMISGSAIFMAIRLFMAPSNIILMALIAAISIMVMVVIMNLKRFRGKSDSVFYGYGLGLGSACGLATGFCYLVYGNLLKAEAGLDLSVVSLVIMSVSMAMILGACGTTVGEGIARHRVMEFALQALLPLVAYYMLFAAAIGTGDSLLYYLYLTLMLVLGAVYYYYIMWRKLPSIIREVLRMEGKKRDDIPRV